MISSATIKKLALKLKLLYLATETDDIFEKDLRGISERSFFVFITFP